MQFLCSLSGAFHLWYCQWLNSRRCQNSSMSICGFFVQASRVQRARQCRCSYLLASLPRNINSYTKRNIQLYVVGDIADTLRRREAPQDCSTSEQQNKSIKYKERRKSKRGTKDKERKTKKRKTKRERERESERERNKEIITTLVFTFGRVIVSRAREQSNTSECFRHALIVAAKHTWPCDLPSGRSRQLFVWWFAVLLAIAWLFGSQQQW